MKKTNIGIILIVDTAVERSLDIPSNATQPSSGLAAQLEQLKAIDAPLYVLFAQSRWQSNYLLESLQCHYGIAPDSRSTSTLLAYGAHQNQHWHGWAFCFLSSGVQASAVARLIHSQQTDVLDAPLFSAASVFTAAQEFYPADEVETHIPTGETNERLPMLFPRHCGYALITQQTMSELAHSVSHANRPYSQPRQLRPIYSRTLDSKIPDSKTSQQLTGWRH